MDTDHSAPWSHQKASRLLLQGRHKLAGIVASMISRCYMMIVADMDTADNAPSCHQKASTGGAAGQARSCRHVDDR
jgi:hypothetical protein